MLEELKRRSLKSRIVTILILLAVAVGLLFVTDFGAFRFLGGARPLEELDVSELNGKYVETEVFFIYEWYAGKESVDKSTNRSTLLEKEYIIPIGESEFMGLLVGEKYLDRADDLMEASQNILFGESEEPGESFVVRGTIMPMDEDSLSYYHYVMGYDECSEEEKALVLPLVLKVDHLGRTEQALTWFLTGVAALCLAGSVWMLVASLTGWYQREIRAFCQKSESPEAMLEQLDLFYQNTEPVQGVRMGQWLMFEAGGRTVILDSGDIIWAYLRTVQHRTNSIPTGKTYGIMLRTRDVKKYYEVSMKNENAAREALDALHCAYPRMVVGYAPELEKLYNSDREAFMHLTDPKPQPTVET